MEIVLSDEERVELVHQAGLPDRRTAERAPIIVACADGMSNAGAACAVGAGVKTVPQVAWAQLARWSRRAKTSKYLALRAKIALPRAEGVTNDQVATDLGVDQSIVDRWRARLVADRLHDEPRTGHVAHPRSCSTRSKTSSSRPWNPHQARTPIGELHHCHRAVEFRSS